MVPKPVSTLLLSLAVVALLPLAAAPADAQLTTIVGTDAWPAAGIIEIGGFTCADGELQLRNLPGVPVPIPYCLAGEGPLEWRGGAGWSCFKSSAMSGPPEPRFSGLAYMTFNANLDPTDDANPAYIGRVWGKWILVPHPDCATISPEQVAGLLENPESFWRGTWRGKRGLVCDSGGCRWLGAVVLAGRGYGPMLRRHRFIGEETVQTFSPLPFPYELLGMCAPGVPCPDEGNITGIIRRR